MIAAPRRLSLMVLGVLLFGVLVAFTMGAFTGTACAAVPEIVGVSPHEGQPTQWGRTNVVVTYRPGTSPLDEAACTLSINGIEVPQKAPPQNYDMPSGSQLTFVDLPTIGAGEVELKVEIVTEAGERIMKEWSYALTEEKAPGLINFVLIDKWWKFIAAGAGMTLALTGVSIVIACVLGLLGALGRLSKKMSFRQAWRKYRSWWFMAKYCLHMIPCWIATFYTSLFRGTPLLLQIFVIYYAIPAFNNYMTVRWSVWASVPDPSAFVSGVLALSLNYGAFITETFRAGIQAVPRGQSEAAWTVGMTGWQTQLRIVLPQALKVVIPALGNNCISLIKDTSLVSTIAVAEVLKRAQLVGGRYYDYLSPLLVAAMVYWVLTIFFNFWQNRLEQKLERDRDRDR